MPGRKQTFLKGGFYHVFNKTIDQQKPFDMVENCSRFLELLEYYRSSKSKISFSKLKSLSPDIQKQIIKTTTNKRYFMIELFGYCLMPNHFHMLFRQKTNTSISIFMSDLINAFTRYYNIKRERKGPLFLTNFKAVPILSEAQLIHVLRYIHLNPYSSGLIKNVEDLLTYPWSSHDQYAKPSKRGLCQTDLCLDLLGKENNRYQDFIINHADYQKNLEIIKHTQKWK